MVGSIFFFVRVLLDGVFVLFFAFGRVLKRFRQGSLLFSHGQKHRIAVARNSRRNTSATVVNVCAFVDGVQSSGQLLLSHLVTSQAPIPGPMEEKTKTETRKNH